MKREIAAITFSALLAGTAFAGPIEQSDLPTPAQSVAPANASETIEDAKLRGLIEDALKDRKHRKTAHAAKPVPSAQSFMHEDWNTYSSAELWLEGIPESEGISLDEIARRNRLNPAYANARREQHTVPTTYSWNNGNWKANFGTNVTTVTTTTVIPSEHYAGAISSTGGTGEFKGRIEYDLNAWQFYGGTQRSLVANADGTLSVNQNFSGGTFYSLPPSLLGGKLGTGFEVNPTGDAKTRLEYRQMFGNTEGFLAAERTSPFQHTNPDVTGSNALKAGINRKF